jgi:hypothetical protein
MTSARIPAIGGESPIVLFGGEHAEAQTVRSPIVCGRFELRFRDESAAHAAARDARCVGFVASVAKQTANAWLITSRRREPFARDDGDRYASRLRAIAAEHRGEYAGFVEDDHARD